MKAEPIRMSPTVTITIMTTTNAGFKTRSNLIIKGNDNAVTDMSYVSAVPSQKPLCTKASTLDGVSKISTYIRTPDNVATITDYQELCFATQITSTEASKRLEYCNVQRNPKRFWRRRLVRIVSRSSSAKVHKRSHRSFSVGRSSRAAL